MAVRADEVALSELLENLASFPRPHRRDRLPLRATDMVEVHAYCWKSLPAVRTWIALQTVDPSTERQKTLMPVEAHVERAVVSFRDFGVGVVVLLAVGCHASLAVRTVPTRPVPSTSREAEVRNGLLHAAGGAGLRVHQKRIVQLISSSNADVFESVSNVS